MTGGFFSGGSTSSTGTVVTRSVNRLEDLRDVDVVDENLTDGQILQWNHDIQRWKAGSAQGIQVDVDLDNLNNVDTTGKADGDIVAWDSTANEWQSKAAGEVLTAGAGIDIVNDAITLEGEVFTTADHTKLDGIEAMADVTPGRFSTSADGLVPAPDSDDAISSYYLGGDGAWHEIGTPVHDSAHISLSISPTSAQTGSGNQTVSCTVMITNLASGETHTNPVLTVAGPGQTSTTISLTESPTDTFTGSYVASLSTVGTFTFHVSAMFTLSGQATASHSDSATFQVTAAPVVNDDWYAQILSTIPANVAAFSADANQDEWPSSGADSVEFNITSAGGANDRAYIALPTDGSTTYEFGGDSNFILKFTADDVTPSGFNSGYIVYRLSTDDVDPTQTGTITVFVGEN